ncbi:MAG: hypothetical protein H0T99_11800 [Geodermatophilaceae bacterium]|nr:hypothetical protein [Geodermatophilaceae bacterium]
MRNRRTALISAAVLVIGAGLFGIGAFPASGAPPSTGQSLTAGWDGLRVASLAEAERRMDAEAGAEGETLVFFGVETGFAVVDVSPTGISPGDFVLFEEDLYTDKDRTQPAGFDSARTELSLTTAHVEGTFQVSGGKISVAGTAFGTAGSTIYSIVGGTGRYADAGGVFIPFELPGGDTALLFRVLR